MRKFLSVFLIVALLIPSCFIVASAAETSPKTTINVYNWGQYISDGTDGYIDVNKAFTEATGITVNYITYDSNETLYSKLKTGGVTIDVIIPSDYMAARLINEGLVQKIDFDNVPNAKYIDDEFKNMDYDPTNEYTVPYTWGTVGVIYNSKYVTKEVTSWDILWDSDYMGKILMFDNPRDAFSLAEFRLGYSINTTDREQLLASAELLSQQNSLVQAYVMDQIYDLMISEEAWIAPYYAGDYLMMAEENENLEFCFPQEGFNVFVDAMCIPTCAQNKEGAEAYINFLCNPQVSGENLDYLGYSTPISAAKQYMDEELAANEVAYPSAETLARSMSFSYLPAEATQTMDSLWLEVKTTFATEKYLAIAGAVVILIGLAFLFAHIRKQKIRARRRKKREERRKK